jgi:hypothetical protein
MFMRTKTIALVVVAAALALSVLAGCDKGTTINVEESIRVNDSLQIPQSAIINVLEKIGVTDSPQTSQSAWVSLTETIGVTDSVHVSPSIVINVVETVHVSDSPTLTPKQVQVTVTVASPNAGAVWVVGTAQNIAWMTTGKGIAYVSVYYSIDGGKSMYSITPKESNDGIYTWKVPNTPSKTVLVRVLGYNANGETLALGDSGLFTISIQQMNE